MKDKGRVKAGLPSQCPSMYLADLRKSLNRPSGKNRNSNQENMDF